MSTVTLPAAVNLPCASTVNVGIALAEPYEPAVTEVLSKLILCAIPSPEVAPDDDRAVPACKVLT